MTALYKVLTILALWFLYTFALYWLASDTLCLGCGAGGGAMEAAAPPLTPAEPAEFRRYPIDFRWSEAEAFTNAGYRAFRDSLLALQDEDNILEITGLYFEEEPAPEGFQNMGFARAEQVRQLFLDDIPAERTRIRARLVEAPAGAREGFFQGVIFDWIATEEKVAETVEELPDRVNIRFPYNSVEKDYAEEVEQYLQRLAENLVQTGRRVRLTGHADNTGPPDYNEQLGLERAQAIRDVLIGYGVPADQIQVESKGETQPIASNDTPEGRHENRRVEIRVME